MNRIRRLALAAFALAASAAPAAAAERTYPVTDFDRIQVEGPFEVSLATGVSTRLRATGSADALERISVEVEGQTLRIRVNPSAWGASRDGGAAPVRIEAATRDLARATLLGSGTLTIDKARGLRLDLNVAGSGHLSVGSVDADNLIVGLAGSGKVALAGHAKQMRATVQGSGDLDAAALRVEDLILGADTAGQVTLGAARTANVTATGAGDVTIGGTPACTVSSKGTGRVRCGP